MNADRFHLPPMPWRSLILAGLAGAAFLVLGPAPQALVYDRAALARGEIWRLATAHLAHAGAGHLVWDAAGLLALGFIFEARLGRLFLPVAAAGTLALDLWLWGFSGLSRYCGLSGVCNVILAAGLCALWRESRSRTAPAVAALALGKIALEMSKSEALFASLDWPPAPMAHAVGFAAGCLAVCLFERPAGRSGRLPARARPYRPNPVIHPATGE